MSVQPVENQDPTLVTLDYRTERVDLAAAFRWAARLDLHEGIANHFSLAVSPDGRQFLVNPFGRHFARIRASELVLLDSAVSGDRAPDPRVEATAWCIHGPIHRLAPQARCILHTHMINATVLSCLEDSDLPPIDQNTMRFYGDVAIDVGFEGMAFSEAEGERLAGVLGDKRVLVMGNHGALVVGESVADAFDRLYYFEKACATVVAAYATGRELRVVSDAVARRTVADWETYHHASVLHFNELKAMLDESEPDYSD
jgi:ribulose-5-phosphate 4-epimerase/fuculose-1-phosphate aldolase